MVECNSIEPPNIYLNLNDQQQPLQNETKERALISQRLTKYTKYIASFEYFDKSLIVLSFLLHHLQVLLEHLDE